MGKVSNQWDFGELFEEKELKKTYSVSELNGAIRKTLEKGFGRVRVTGEVSNFRAQGSGHCYFGLKDQSAQVSCVLFRSERVSHRSEIDNGVKVILEGDLTVYEARGQYQLIIRAIELQGIGALQLAFERLKKKLEGEGLFDTQRKREIPRYCFRLGIVTSSNAAALRDVLQISGRRHSALQTVLLPVRVQGQGAAEEIAAAIKGLNRYSASLPERDRLQAILVTRGGGSLEDLWAFNEEVVARSVAGSELPVVSAVGHEVDFTICDFVADLRAPTPSAAAEILTEGVFSSRETIHRSKEQLQAMALREVGHLSSIIEQIGHRLGACHPRRTLDLFRQGIDDFEIALGRQVSETCQMEAHKLEQLGRQLLMYQPQRMIDRERESVEGLSGLVLERLHGASDLKTRQLDHLGKMLRLLSPLNVLERGYSITRETESGRIVGSVQEIEKGASLTTLVKDGELVSDVKETKQDQSIG
ncbi:exodeoxyribonuclease VII large subunit [bacterium]|nr:exodeoxyribonuclease VII large subunit [bacterium]